MSLREFSSFGSFATHIGTMVAAEIVAEHVALERIGKLIEKRAKEKIGTYQPETGEFIAWPELADSTKEQRLALGYTENDPLLRSGAMRDSVEHHVEPTEVSIGSNMDEAVWQELGTNRIPPRSFLGGAAVDKMEEVLEILGTAVVLALCGEKVHEGQLVLPSGAGGA